MEFVVPLLSGFVLGCLHAFDADHMAAVTALASGTRRVLPAVRLGIAWGLGHSATLLIVGVIVVAFQIAIPIIVQETMELLIGAILVALGLWTLRSVLHNRHVHVHSHTHEGQDHIHFHAHTAVEREDHHHRHSMFAIGAAHGLAGTGSVVLLIPIALTNAPFAAFGFLVSFGIGTMMAMAMFSLLFSYAVNTIAAGRWIVAIRGGAGIASLIVGIVWITERLT